MARVPTVEQQVAARPIATPFDQGRGASEAAFGGREGVAQQNTGQRLQQLSDSLAAQSLEIQRSKNDRALKDMDIRLSEAVRPLLNGDGENPGLLNSTGEQAVESAPGTVEAINKARAEILSSAPNSRVKGLWDQSSKIGLQKTFDRISQHTNAQHKVARIGATEAWRENAMADALVNHTDTEAVLEGLSRIRIATEDLAELNGWTPEQIELENAQQEARLHEGVVDRFLAPGDSASVVEAREYFESVRDGLTGSAIAPIEKKLSNASNENLSALRRQTSEAVDLLEADKTPENLARLRTELEGTGERGEELLLALDRAEADRPIMSEFNQLSIQERNNAIQNLVDQDPASADDLRILNKMRGSLRRDMQSIAAGDGIMVAFNNKVISSLPDIDFTDPSSWRTRTSLATAASNRLGQSISPLTKAESDRFGQVLTSGTLDEAVATLAAVVDGAGQDVSDRLAQDVADDYPAVSAAIALANEAPLLARSVLSGIRRADANPNLVPEREEVDPIIEDELEGVFGENSSGESLAVIREGALALLAASGDPSRVVKGSLDPDELESAIQQFTGGVLTNTQGRKVIAPIRGMTQSDFEASQLDIKAPDMIEFGSGVPVFNDGSPVPPSILEDGGELVSSGIGQYLVHIPGQGFVQNLDGGAYEINLRSAIEDGGLNTDLLETERLAVEQGVEPGSVEDVLFANPTRGIDEGEDLSSTPEQRPSIEPAGSPAPEVVRPEPEQEIIQQSGRPKPKPAREVEQVLINSLMRDECFSPDVYIDSEGFPTIGFGHRVLEGEDFTTITKEEGMDLLRKDMESHLADARSLPFYEGLNPARQVVIANMVFNLGLSGFKEFKKTINHIENEEWEQASAEMLNSRWHDQVGGRARRLAEIMRRGSF